MALIENWLPPTRQNWELIVYYFQFFPIVRTSYDYSHSSSLVQDSHIGSSPPFSGLYHGMAQVKPLARRFSTFLAAGRGLQWRSLDLLRCYM